MPVHEDSSIAPDSTLSTSPPTTPILKRSARVYGRARPAAPVHAGYDSALLQSVQSSSSSSSIYRTAPVDADEELPPSSDPALDVSMSSHVDDSNEEDDSNDAPSSHRFAWKDDLEKMDENENSDVDEEGPTSAKSMKGLDLSMSTRVDDSNVENDSDDASSGFQFSWKKKLKKIDEDEGSDSDVEGAATEKNASKGQVELDPSPALSLSKINSLNAPFITSSGDESQEDIFSEANLGGSSPSSHLAHTPSLQQAARVRRKVPIVYGSESEDGEKQFSPSNPHPITTPKLHSSPTPPTSEDGMSTLHKHTKGIAKEKAPVHRDVPPLLFDTNPAPISAKARTTLKDQRQKIKAPTKKDLKETARSRLRIAAEQQVSIPRTNVQATSKLSIQSFFSRISTEPAKTQAKHAESEADPIVDFSSPQRHSSPLPPLNLSTPPLPNGKGLPPTNSQMDLPKAGQELADLANESDEELPEVGFWAQQKRKAVEVEKRMQDLQERKRALVMHAAPSISVDDDEDDDGLQVVQAPDMQMAIKEEEAERRSGRKKRISDGRKRQLNLGGIGLNAQKAKMNPPKIHDIDLLRRTAMQQGKKGDPTMTPDQLKQIMFARAEAKRLEAVRAKEEEWTQRGGRLKNQGDEGTTESSVQEASKLYAQKGRSLFEGRVDTMAVDESDSSDEDWSPESNSQLRGSASPSPGADNDEEADIGMFDNDKIHVELEEDDSNERIPLRSRRLIVDSDDEDAAPTPIKGPLTQSEDEVQMHVHRGSISSFEDPTEDEGDKENETSRMWDYGDDKENTAVVRHVPLEAQLDDDPFSSPSRPSRLPTSFEARLKLASPAASQPSTSPPSLEPFIGSKGLGFSQFPDEAVAIRPSPLQASFSDLFESGSEKQSVSILIKSPTEASSRNQLARAGTLNLTQDVTLQPAFEVSEALLRKADQIFEKEQEFVVEAANKKPPTEPELYVNDHGFLTQTRPEVSTPEIYRHPSPTQAKSTSRRPLGTLSLDKIDSPASLSRLHRRATTPTSPLRGMSYKSSPSRSPSTKRTVNAFDVLQRRKEPRQKPLGKSEFIEEEAQESDEDEMFGFGHKVRGKDDEDDGEDLDKQLDTLVDDAVMDDETVGAELVKEKFMEHEKEDDEALQKLHQAAVQGELRKKRKNGVLGMDDSDDDSDDDEHARRIRRGMKKQRIERDNILALGEHEDTRSFFHVYKENLSTDVTEFEYLHESQPTVPEVDAMDGEAPRERIAAAEVTRLMREVARGEVEEKALDLNDVTWVDKHQGDEEDSPRIKPLKHSAKQPTRKRPDQMEFETGFGALSMPPPKPVVGEHSMSRMQTWAKVEGRSRHSGTTGRNVGGAAVTGHKTKSGGGSLRKGPAAASTSANQPSESRKPIKEPSFLAKVAADSRTSRFG